MLLQNHLHVSVAMIEFIVIIAIIVLILQHKMANVNRIVQMDKLIVFVEQIKITVLLQRFAHQVQPRADRVKILPVLT